MRSGDRELGMGRDITRRDFLYGAVGTLVAGATLSSGCSDSGPTPAPGPVGAGLPPRSPNAHPPSRLGLRGTHDGAFEVAHQMAFEKRTDWGPAAEPDAVEYDLVVVGAGMSGLSAAWFYREQRPDARILLLENHDDFGGHARRNEFEWQGRTILCHGGSQSLEAPGEYSDVAMGLLRRIGVEPERLRAAYDEDFYRRHGLGMALFFDRAHYGVDRLVRSDFLDPSLFLPVAHSGRSLADVIDQVPISEPARKQLLRLTEASGDRLTEHSIFAEPGYLETISYYDLLTKDLGITDPEVLAILREVPGSYFGHGIEMVSALECLGFGMPGLGATSLGRFEGILRRLLAWSSEPYFFHFPDGNVSVVRQLVRRMIPEVAEGETMEDVVTASFDYDALDRGGSPVRIRLGSTVVRAAHEGDPRSAERVVVTYVRGGRTERVRAKHVVLACYNMVVPYLCPELPEAQKAALASLVKIPFVYTSVLLRDWRAFEKLGVGMVYAPGSWHRTAMLDFPVSLGDYRYSPSPSEPIAVHMDRSLSSSQGRTPRERSRLGRYELLGTTFETLEREIRLQLAGNALRGRLRSRARHRGHHGEPLAPRLRVHPQPALRPGVRARRGPARDRTQALRPDHDRQLRCGRPGLLRPGDRPGLARGGRARPGRRPALTHFVACPRIPAEPAFAREGSREVGGDRRRGHRRTARGHRLRADLVVESPGDPRAARGPARRARAEGHAAHAAPRARPCPSTTCVMAAPCTPPPTSPGGASCATAGALARC